MNRFRVQRFWVEVRGRQVSVDRRGSTGVGSTGGSTGAGSTGAGSTGAGSTGGVNRCGLTGAGSTGAGSRGVGLTAGLLSTTGLLGAGAELSLPTTATTTARRPAREQACACDAAKHGQEFCWNLMRVGWRPSLARPAKGSVAGCFRISGQCAVLLHADHRGFAVGWRRGRIIFDD